MQPHLPIGITCPKLDFTYDCPTYTYMYDTVAYKEHDSPLWHCMHTLALFLYI